MDKTKILAIILMSIICFNSCGLVWGIGIQCAFVRATSDTCTITNIIYFNATGMGKTTSEIKRITISETLDPTTPNDPSWKNIPWKDGTIASENFAPNTSVEVRPVQSPWESQDVTADTIEFMGATIPKAENCDHGMGFIYNDNIMAWNTSDWIDEGISFPDVSYPTLQKSVLFNSPAVYVNTFCDENGYVLREILNSTYNVEYDMNTLNIFRSQLVKIDLLICNMTDDESLSIPKQYHNADIKLTGAEELFIAFVIAIVLIFFVTPVVITCLNNKAARDALNDINEDNAEVLLAGIDATLAITEMALADKAAAYQTAMDMYNNGTIDWGQLQYLLKYIDGSYNPLINNCTLNIGQMVNGYFNSTVGLYDIFHRGLGAEASWTDTIMAIIKLIAVLMVVYIVYVVISKFKTAQAPIQSVYLLKT